MSFEHYDSLFTFAAAGLGLLLAGGLNLAFGRSGRFIVVRSVATLAVCGAVAGGLIALTRPELAVRAASVLLGVLLGTTVLGAEWGLRALVAAVTLFRRPGPRWGLVALSGLGLVVGSGVAFDRAEDEAINQTMHVLEVVAGHAPAQPTHRARATTDRGTPIILKEPLAPRDPAELAEPEEYVLRHTKGHQQAIRQSGPSDTSNCHGWVFTGGRFILSPEDVGTILVENGYHEVHEPQPGDLVIYRKDGTILHSAIVRYVTEGRPVLIEGKWGAMGVFLHAVDRSDYGSEYTFVRSARRGHLLVGLGSESPGAEAHGTSE